MPALACRYQARIREDVPASQPMIWSITRSGMPSSMRTGSSCVTGVLQPRVTHPSVLQQPLPVVVVRVRAERATDGGIILAVRDPNPRPPTPRAHDASTTWGPQTHPHPDHAQPLRLLPYPAKPRKDHLGGGPRSPQQHPGEPGFSGQQAARMLIGRVLTGLRELSLNRSAAAPRSHA
jgi:hypothetical protein